MGIAFKTVEARSYFVTITELVQMKLDKLVEDFMNLDINNESMDDNRSHSQD